MADKTNANIGFEKQLWDEWKGTDYWDWSLPSPYEN